MSQRFQRVVRNIRICQFFRRLGEDTGDIHGHVPHANNCNAVYRKVELEIGKVRMTVVPGDKLRRRVRAREILTRYIQVAINLGARGEDDLMVVLLQIFEADMFAILDVTEESKARGLGTLVIGPCDGLVLLMIGGNAGTHQTKWRR